MSPRAWKLVSYGIAAFAGFLLIAPLGLVFIPRPLEGRDPETVSDELEAQGKRSERVLADQSLLAAQILGAAAFLAVGVAVGGVFVTNNLERQLKEGK